MRPGLENACRRHKALGRDIGERLASSGFADPQIATGKDPSGMGHTPPCRHRPQDMNRILIVAPFAPECRTAGQNYTLRMIEDLARGHLVDPACRYLVSGGSPVHSPLRETLLGRYPKKTFRGILKHGV
jgi:hypothetical protein